jgi:hypothetical protein
LPQIHECILYIFLRVANNSLSKTKMKQDYKNTKRPIPDIDPEDPTRMKDPTEDMGVWNEKTFQEDLVGDDLDVPGSDSEMDIEQENNDLEDEENSYYSLGGDNHDDLEENRGLD